MVSNIHWMDVSNEELSGGLVTGVSLGLRNGHIKTRKVRVVLVPGDVDQMASDTLVLLDIQTTEERRKIREDFFEAFP